jgi:hypothetical protein
LSVQARSFASGWASNLMAARLADLYRDLTHQHLRAVVAA